MKFASLIPLTALLTFAQLPTAVITPLGPPPQLEPGEGARIEGVVRSTEGEPIVRATVRLQGTLQPGEPLPNQQTATADDGTFVFENIPPGRNYRLSVQRAGFANTTYGTRRAEIPGRPLTLARGQMLKNVVIEMPAQGVIAGTITDVNCDPIANATVTLMRRGYQQGVRRLLPVQTTSANDIGEYRIAALAAGTYYLRVTERSLISGITGNESLDAVSNIPTYYPTAAEERGTRPIAITPGTEILGANVQLRRGRTFEISGTIVDPDGKPLAGVPMLALPDDGLPDLASVVSGIQPSRPDGTFAVRGLSAGAYILQNLPAATNGANYVAREPVTIVDKNVTGLVLQASLGGMVQGSITVEDGSTEPLLAVPAARPLIALSVLPGLGGSRSGQVQNDGTFEITAMQPGEATLNIGRLPETVYIKSVRLGDSDVTHSKIAVGTGANPALEIVLSTKAAAIVGVVEGASSSVTLWPADPDPGLPNDGFRSASADQNGGFEFHSLPPGVYYLAAWEDADPGLLMNHEFRDKFTGSAMKIELAEGAQQAVEAPVISAEAYAAEEEKLP